MNKNINILIKKLYKKIKKIENYNILQTKKNKLYKKEALIFKKKIKKKKLSINSYITYISRSRKQFINIKHHSFKKNINYIKKKINFKIIINNSINKIKYNIILFNYFLFKINNYLY